MNGLNKVTLIGNLGKDPELKTFESGSKVAKFSLGVTEKYKNKSGEVVSNTEWFDLEAWEGIAGIAEKYLKKGSPIYVEGKQKTETWENEAGEKRSRKVVRVSQLIMLPSGGKPESQNEAEIDSENSDLPF